MGNKLKKKQILIVLLLLIGAIAAILLWNSVTMYLTPKAVLTSALRDSLADLEYRFQNSPMQTLMKGYDAQGQNTVQLDLHTSDNLLGDVSYDMMLQTDWNKNQITAQGTVATASQSLNLSAYLDKDFAALTSEELLEGGYYGITFDTFSEDLRSIPLLTFFLPEETLQSWETSVNKLEAWMNRSVAFPEIPQISQQQLQMITLGILTLKCDISEAEVMLEDESLHCHRLTYAASGEQVSDILSQVLNAPPSDNGSISATFYLLDESLVKVELNGVSGENQINCVITLGKDPKTDALSLAVIQKQGEISKQFSASVSARKIADKGIQEAVCIQDTSFTYIWDNTNGYTELFLPGKEQIDLILKEDDNGFCVQTKDFAPLFGFNSQKSYDCTMHISKGSQISQPEYKNLNTWSFQDLLTLISGIGSVLGISFETITQ